MARKPPKNFHPEPFAYHEEVEVEITDLTNLGDGVGRVGDWVVMVPFALPGERVRASIWRNKKNYSDADLVEVLQPSPQRVDPLCPLFGKCGGCQYQHYSYEGQLEWKRKQVVDLLERLAGIPHPKVLPTHPSPRQFGYRSKLTPHYPRPRDGELGPVGFQHTGSRAILDVPQCPIATEAINQAMPEARANLRHAAKRKKRGGTLLLRDTLEGVVTDMSATVSSRVSGTFFQFRAGEFFQNNPYILPEMVDDVIAQAKGPGDVRYLVDAYCGVGVFSLCGADQFEQVAGVEINSNAIQFANSNAVANHVKNVDFLIGSAEAIFAKIEFPGSETAVIIDPPRKGCDEAFLEQLFTFGPYRVVYVSCGPDTQARDTQAFLKAGYRITRIQPYDLFPQTRHIENVMTFER